MSKPIATSRQWRHASLLQWPARITPCAGTPLSNAKYGNLRDRLQRKETAGGLLGAFFSSDNELAFAHRPDCIAAITVGKGEPQILLEIGFPWTAAMAERVRRSVGDTLQAAGAELLLNSVWAGPEDDANVAI
jgi:hypothetical protein